MSNSFHFPYKYIVCALVLGALGAVAAFFLLQEDEPVPHRFRTLIVEDERTLEMRLSDGRLFVMPSLQPSGAPRGYADANAVEITKDSARTILIIALDSARHRSEELLSLAREMAYYEQTHSEADSNYHDVLAVRGFIEAQNDSIDKLVKALEATLDGRLPEVTEHRELTIFYAPLDAADSLQHSERARLADRNRPDTMCFEPSFAAHLSVYGSTVKRIAVMPYGKGLAAAKRRPASPLLAPTDSAQTLLPLRYDYPSGAFFLGRLDSLGHRSGRGLLKGASGRIYSGVWAADSLAEGEMRDGTGVFRGSFNALLRPHGHGRYDGRYWYEGEWKNGQRHGIGRGLEPGKVIGYGQWKGGQYFGEEWVHNGNRVYGIDISRYQHEKHKRTAPIHWTNMRTTKLARKVRHSVDGVLDFPISFCFIKASQGVDKVNDYLDDDTFLARMNGMHVGHYHYFTPDDGAAQGRWFLQCAKPQHGDLPPVLDLEMSDERIQKMGGPVVMMREVSAWLKVVGERCGTLPIVYSYQSFIEKYFKYATPDILECPLWVARYSSFRPGYHFDFWQFSCEGAVRGIAFDVDLNVYNGSLSQFETFVEEHGVK